MNVAVMELKNYLCRKMDDKSAKIISGEFVDLRKAFNAVQHGLYRAGVRGVFSSYLEDRYQFVQFNGIFIALKPITVGVVQYKDLV